MALGLLRTFDMTMRSVQAIVEFIDYHDVKSVANVKAGSSVAPTSKASITTQIGARFVISGRGGIASAESCYHDRLTPLSSQSLAYDFERIVR